MAMMKRPSMVRQEATGSSTSTLDLGDAVTGFRTMAGAGLASGDYVPYWLEYGSAWEYGIGKLGTSAVTLERSSDRLIESSSGSLLSVTEDDPCEVAIGPGVCDTWRGFAVRRNDTTMNVSTASETDVTYNELLVDTDSVWTGSGQSSFTLPDWVGAIEVYGNFQINNDTDPDGYRQATLYLPGSTSVLSEMDPGTANSWDDLQVQGAVVVFTPGSSNTVKMAAYQNSGSTLTLRFAHLVCRYIG